MSRPIGNRLDRRTFLRGAGTALAVPMLSSLLPRKAAAQALVAPKRLIIVFHEHGRVVGNGLQCDSQQRCISPYDNGGSQPPLTVQDLWSPGTVTGPLPTNASGTTLNTLPPSTMLAALAPIVNEIVTLDGVDNILRHACTQGMNATDGHNCPGVTALTGVLPSSDGQTAGGASIDYIAGLRLRANAAMAPTYLLAADSGLFYGNVNWFWGPNGSPPSVANPDCDPATAMNTLFANFNAPPPPPTPTLQQILAQNRVSLLDGVLPAFAALRAKVNATDQATLDNHAQFIRDLETSLGTASGGQPTQACSPPNPSSIPNWQTGNTSEGAKDNITTPIVMNLAVQALACDITRSIAINFSADSPTFPWAFPNGSPFSSTDNSLGWHTQIHSTGFLSDASAPGLKTGFNFYGQMFTQLVQLLASTPDIDGSRMLDNTLVVWASPMGYGSSHACFNVPIVMAGMKSAFPKGQGRHVVCNRNSLNDLWAEVLRMLGGTDATFGATGTLGSFPGAASTNCSLAYCQDYGYPGFITADTPIQMGPIDL
jgi:hypothetical protein